jgi:hypothetical protein
MPMLDGRGQKQLPHDRVSLIRQLICEAYRTGAGRHVTRVTPGASVISGPGSSHDLREPLPVFSQGWMQAPETRPAAW